MILFNICYNKVSTTCGYTRTLSFICDGCSVCWGLVAQYNAGQTSNNSLTTIPDISIHHPHSLVFCSVRISDVPVKFVLLHLRSLMDPITFSIASFFIYIMWCIFFYLFYLYKIDELLFLRFSFYQTYNVFLLKFLNNVSLRCNLLYSNIYNYYR